MSKDSCDPNFVENAEAQTTETSPSTELPQVTVGTSSLSTETTHQACMPQEAQTTESSSSTEPPQVTVGTSGLSTETTHQACMPQATATQSGIFGTSREEKLCKKLRILQSKLSICRYRTRKHCKTLKVAQNILKSKSFMEMVENMNSATKILNLLQSRKQKRSKRTSRFTFNESITSLPIYTQSPKAYQFLSKIFLLPESKQLEKLIQKIVIKPSISKKVWQSLRDKARTMLPKTRLCVLLFDQVVLQPNVSYSVLDDKINIHIGEGSSQNLASHVMVFMLKGIFKNYVQPIVYALSSEPTSLELKIYIQNIIRDVSKAGFVVIATVCKQANNNQEAIESLIEDTRREKLESGEEHSINTFYIGQLEVIPFYDPPNLIKDFRNNLLNMPLLHENEQGKICTAKWEHIERLYAMDLVSKLTDQHVVPGKVNKRKVEYASQIFSHSVAAYMFFNSHHGNLPPECKDTSNLIFLIDDLFDSMNGSWGNEDIEWQPLLGALMPSPQCPHHKKWKEIKKVFKSMELLNGDNIHVPTIKKYLWDIEQFEYLCRMLAVKYGISVVWTRRINQDPLEKFLGPSCVTGAGITSEAHTESNQPVI